MTSYDASTITKIRKLLRLRAILNTSFVFKIRSAKDHTQDFQVVQCIFHAFTYLKTSG